VLDPWAGRGSEGSGVGWGNSFSHYPMSIGFKEWALVCEALGQGRQSLILRKGGIAEGRDGFRFQHSDFLLMPTLFHEQAEKLKVPPGTPLPGREDGIHRIHWGVTVEWTRDLTDWEQVRRLAPFHLWTEEVIRERFLYDGREMVCLAWVRAFRLSEPLVFEDAPKYGGCRSWVNLPELPAGVAREAVLTEAEHGEREREILSALGGPEQG
jgi:hypothetical protein